jgi:hypothetical protein
MTKHVTSPLQIASGGMRLWTYDAECGGSVIVADFSVSGALREETKVENARRARAAWNLCQGLSTEQLETLLKGGQTVATLTARR